MVESSPIRPRSYHWTSPARSTLSDIIFDDLERNTERRHNAEIQAAQMQRERLREEAEQVLRDYEKAEQHRHLMEERKKEEQRIQREQNLATERLRLLELKAKKVEIPPLPPPSPEPPKAPPVASKPLAPTTNPEVAAKCTPSVTQPSANGQPKEILRAPGKPPAAAQLPADDSLTELKPTASAQPISLSQAKPQTPPQQGTSTLTRNQQPVPTSAIAPSQPPAQPSPIAAEDRYLVIHKNLKILRKAMNEQTKSNSALKTRMGDMRREIRKNVGQLTSGTGANRKQQTALNGLLREALQNQVNSQMMDPSNFVLKPREPKQGAAHNDQLPSLFLYMINTLAKAAISQFINEAGARPETADPVGVVLASTFSDPEFQWRGLSLIDILLAKFRVVCPVVFGYNGKESTEQGRARLGWKKAGSWIPEQEHMDRMTGLGAGFAAISLRNFKKSPKVNPFPPRNYWHAMSNIVNTASADISNTQCVVLKAMIQNFEAKFLEAYGSTGISALRLALVELPRRSHAKGPAVASLEVHAKVIKGNTGLDLFA